MTRPILAAAFALATLPATAQELARVTDEATFRSEIAGRNLTTRGITVRAQPDGTISGRGMGFSVSGSWSWRDGFFCREMSTAVQSWGMNCQVVYHGGDTVRFVADQGQGDTATLTIE